MQSERLEILLLAWLHLRPRDRREARVIDGLTALFDGRADARARVIATIGAAIADGAIARDGALRLTARGLEILRADPIGHAKSWRELLDRLLPARILGATSNDADALRSVILATERKLEKPPRTPAQLRNAIVWKLLGFAGSGAISAETVASRLLSRELGREKPLPSGAAIRVLCARAVGANRTDARTLRAAIVARWLCVDEHEEFARIVLDAAASATSGRFGRDKVFISHVWRALPRGFAPSLDAFKERLVDAHRAARIKLSRADLVEVMSKSDVGESETRYLSATFHFVQVPS